MKRSEAYNTIRANIKLQPKVHGAALRYQAGEISWGRLCDFIAEEALKQVEKIGMLPPETLIEKFPESYDEYGDENVGLDGVIVRANEWEPEDEKK